MSIAALAFAFLAVDSTYAIWKNDTILRWASPWLAKVGLPDNPEVAAPGERGPDQPRALLAAAQRQRQRVQLGEACGNHRSFRWLVPGELTRTLARRGEVARHLVVGGAIVESGSNHGGSSRVPTEAGWRA